MKISDLTAADLKILIRETIQEGLEEYLMDPDAGLSLRPEVRAQLEAAQTQRTLGQRGIPAAKVAEILGLD
jgi:cobalamin biosynthesis protein CbiG